MYHKFQIGEADRFDVTDFPELQKSLISVAGSLNGQPTGPVADMLLSFVKDHSMDSAFVLGYPGLATMISTKDLPIGVMEDLFEACRQNPGFRKDLETCIRQSLRNTELPVA